MLIDEMQVISSVVTLVDRTRTATATAPSMRTGLMHKKRQLACRHVAVALPPAASHRLPALCTCPALLSVARTRSGIRRARCGPPRLPCNRPPPRRFRPGPTVSSARRPSPTIKTAPPLSVMRRAKRSRTRRTCTTSAGSDSRNSLSAAAPVIVRRTFSSALWTAATMRWSTHTPTPGKSTKALNGGGPRRGPPTSRTSTTPRLTLPRRSLGVKDGPSRKTIMARCGQPG